MFEVKYGFLMVFGSMPFSLLSIVVCSVHGLPLRNLSEQMPKLLPCNLIFNVVTAPFFLNKYIIFARNENGMKMERES